MSLHNPAVAADPPPPPEAAAPGGPLAAGSVAEAAARRGPLTVADDFRVLDDPQEQAAFTRYSDESGRRTADSVLMVQGMTCAACADAVESALVGMPGVLQAEVHAATRRLSVRWDPAQVKASALARAVGAAGYRLLPPREALGITERLAEGRRVLWRLAVAGLCMMQVMMYAWPAYVTEPGDIPPDIEQLLRWASWVLSLPVLVFACGAYFRGAWADLRRGRVGMDTPVTVGILVTFVVSTLATFDRTGPWGHEVWFDSLTMFVFFLAGGRYLEHKARARTAGALDELMNRLPEVCDRRQTDGGFAPVSVRRLAVGDVVRVQAGQAFPGDGVLLSEHASVDEALLTGESHAITRAQGDALVAGSYNLGGPVLLRLDRLGADTRFSQIVALMEKASTERPRLALLADRVAGPFLVVVMLAALAAAVWWWPTDPAKALSVAVAVLIVTCPCALSLATPAAMLASAGALARRGVLLRRLQALESLAQVDTVVFDKTGTLTHDRLQVSAVQMRDGADPAAVHALALALAQGSLHPVARAVVQAATSGAAAVSPVLEELQERVGQGLCARAVWPQPPALGQTVAPAQPALAVRLGSAAFCGVTPPLPGPEGASQVHLADDHGWLATYMLQEAVREDAQATVALLHAHGLRTWLLSGDQPQAAHRVAAQLGIDQVVAGATPEDKLQTVARLQAQGHRVAMVGDGLNDGPVLALAHTSFALGTAAPLAQARSDFVIQGGQLLQVAQSWLQARATLRVVRQNLAWAAGYNAVSVPLALLGHMPPWAAGLGMALSSFWVIGNALRLNRPAAPQPLSTGPIADRAVPTPTPISAPVPSA